MSALPRYLAAVFACLVLNACGESRRDATAVAGDAERGRLLLRQYGCGACHRIPGVAAADGNVGPPLDRVAKRVYLAGMLPNSPENMERWIRAPQEIDPLTGMPDLHVTDAYARDMTAYLYQLE